MLKFYTSVGKLEIQLSDNGLKSPVIISAGKEHVLSVEELIIWSGLQWNIKNREELETYYWNELHEAGLCSEHTFEGLLNRMENQKELVVSGADIVGVDAVYSLLSNLFVIPVVKTPLQRVSAFFKMVWNGIPLRVAWRVFDKAKLTHYEKKILGFSQKQTMSTAELIRCAMLKDPDLSSEAAMVDTIYSLQHLNCQNIAVYGRFSELLYPVVEAVTNLYLKKQVMLEKYV